MAPEQRRFPVLSDKTARAVALKSLINQTKAEILADVIAGRVPVSASTYSELHDYVDANMYAEVPLKFFAELFGCDVADLFNPMSDAIDAWLQCGELVRAVEGVVNVTADVGHAARWFVIDTGGNCQALRHDLDSFHGAHLLATTHDDPSLPVHGEAVRVSYWRSDAAEQPDSEAVLSWLEWLAFRREAERDDRFKAIEPE